MKTKLYIKIICTLTIFLVTSSAFPLAKGLNTTSHPSFYKIVLFPVDAKTSGIVQEDVLTIYKKRKQELNVYTFTPQKQSDKELLSAIENRLKNMIDGFVSLSDKGNNLVEIIIDPHKITEDDFRRTMAIIVKLYDYYPTNYNIIEE